MRRRSLVRVASLLVLLACASPAPRDGVHTTKPPPQTAPASPASGRSARPPTRGTVGYLGCSLTWQTVEGYHAVGGVRLWPVYEGMGSGEISVWAQELQGQPPAHWSVFDHALALDPAHTFWIQACFMTSEIAPDNVQQGEAVVAHIRELVPNAKVYVSPMNTWDPPDICGKADPTAVANAQHVVDALVQEGVALRGPVLPPLPQSETEDACHPDATGEALLGRALLRWLGG